MAQGLTSSHAIVNKLNDLGIKTAEGGEVASQDLHSNQGPTSSGSIITRHRPIAMFGDRSQDILFAFRSFGVISRVTRRSETAFIRLSTSPRMFFGTNTVKLYFPEKERLGTPMVSYHA